VFGFRKSAIQVKGAEKFFEKENRKQEKARKRAARRVTGRAKRFFLLVAALVVVVALGVFIRNQHTQIVQLRALRDAEVERLKLHVSDLSAKLEESDRHVLTLNESIGELEKQVEAERSERVRAEAALRGRTAAAKGKL
jgi:hypothetical protein